MTYKTSNSKEPCKIQDCVKPVMSRGYCKYHYKKFVDIPKEKAKKQTLQEEQKRQQVIAKTATAKAAAIPREKLEKLFLTPCRTEQDLKNYIKYFFNLYLPDCKVSRYADTTPFHAIWEAYDICVNKNNPQNVQELLYVAGRGSGKCVLQGTKIITKTGLKNIEDIKIGEVVYTGWSWQPVLQWFDEGEKEGIEFTTESGKSLTGSLKHRVWGIRNWKYLIDLKIGDEVKVVDEKDQEKSWNEKVVSIKRVKAYFYDLEVEEDHSYWSNGFISHNTLGMAIAELLIMFHDQRDVVHVGAILSQAKRCYEYQQKFILSDRIKPIISPPKTSENLRILEKTNMERSIFNIAGEKISLEVIPCTLKSTNGPHVPLVVVDEIDTVSGEGLRAYKEISGMLDSKRGRKPLRIGISTRKSRYGLMNQAIENAEKQGRHVRKWTAFEFTERCPDSRSGTEKQEFYIDQNSFDVRTTQEYLKLGAQKRKDYTQHIMFEGCYKCPLAPICLGDAKNQVSKSPMLKSIDEMAQKVLSEGADWAMAQLMNLKPSVEGIIYKEFDERVHVKSWNDMWLILTGKEFPGTCDHDIFVKKCHAMGLPAYAGIDWGWSSPHTLVVFFVDSKENIYVVRCDGQTYISRPSWMHHVKNKWHNVYRVQLYFPDLADPGDGVEMRKLGLPTSTNFDKGHINFGTQVVKKWLRVPGSSDTKIFLAEETTKPLVKEFQLYHFKTDAAGLISDDPDTEHDHWLDALRYAMTNLFGKNQVVLSSAGMDMDTSKILDANGNLLKAPTPEEYAKISNITINPEISTDKLGKIGRLSELDGDEEDPESASFIWSI